MNGQKDQRALKSFVQLVNPKAEPIVESSWVKKINTKNREDTRFAVATNAALYLCKLTGLVKNVKISTMFAWVDLTSFESINDSTIKFIFKEASTKLVFPDAIKFAKEIFCVLQRVIPQTYSKIVKDFPALEAIEKSAPRPTQFVDLFLSVCHSMNVEPNIQFCSHLRKSLRMNEPLSLIQGSFDPKVLDASLRAFFLTTTIEYAIFGGFSFPDLFASVGNAIKGNSTVKKLKLTNYSTPKKFGHFLGGLKCSQITHLTFEAVTFKISIIRELAKEIQSTPLKSLIFINCDFNVVTFQPILQSGSNFQNIDYFEISCDETKSHFNCYSELLMFIQESQIKTVRLSQMGIDISTLFRLLQNYPNMKLECLDLTSNYCSSSLIENYTFPSTLRIFKLSNVRWESGTIQTFIAKQSFINEGVHIDFSQARFDGEKTVELFDQLPEYPPTPMILRLNWNHNIITPKLLRYFAEYSFIEKASFDYCKMIPGTDVNSLLESLAFFVSKTQLVKFSIKGTFVKYKTEMLVQIRNALIKSASLKKFDISDNKVGERGLTILKDILLQSSELGDLAFDGSDILDPSSLIRFFNDISKCKHLYRVSKPRRDYMRLYNDSNEKTKTELEESWASLKLRIKNNTKSNMVDASETDSMASYAFSSSFMSSNVYSSSIMSLNSSIIAFSNVEASWDVNINLGYTGSELEWEALRQTYSIPKLAGIQDLLTLTTEAPTNPNFST